MEKFTLKKNDFECYEVILPFTTITGKRRRKYLCSELEKRHPCFSDEFTYDLVLKKLCRKGFQTDVYVMNKRRLAEYERTRTFAGSGFFVKNESGWYSRCFVDKKWRLGFWTIIACLIVGFAGAVCGGLAASVCEKESGVNERDEPLFISDSVFSQGAEGIEGEEKIVSFFQTISDGGGKISHFEWKVQGFTQEMNASVRGIYPETLPTNIRGDPVVYENSLPYMKVSFSERVQKQNEKTAGTKTVMNNLIFSAAVREFAIRNGACLLEEKTEPYHLDFICSCETEVNIDETKRLFEQLSKVIEREGRTVTSLLIKQMKVSELRVGITAEEVPLSGFNLSLISENLQLFLPEEKGSVLEKPSQKIASKAESKSQAALTEASVQGKKLGEIKRPDKTVVIFIKNPEGKMQKIIEMVEEKK